MRRPLLDLRARWLGATGPDRARMVSLPAALNVIICLVSAAVASADDPVSLPPLTIARASGPIALDGALDDAGWQGATPITTWFETNVGDNVEPQVRNVAFLAYDSRYLYAAFRFEDPRPDAIRAPLGDHDAMPPSTDYAGVIVNSLNDGKTAQMFMANPRGAQYDALNSDASGEDSAPDFLWDAAGRITSTGWSLEMRIPYASLRYANQAEPTWQIMLHRNYPRDRRYQFFTARIPRDANCFVCSSTPLVGLADLPRGSHLVVAPYVTAQGAQVPQGDPGSPLETRATETDGGLDLKWSPSTSGAIDLTINPDFSQVESDAAQITANERSALFFPEKRPFFLEGVDLLSTPLPVVYTRSITSPRAGLRATGKRGGTAFTALVTHDRGGGLVILPGPQGSGFALQDFPSDVGILRVRHDLGSSFVSLLATGRMLDQGGSNLVVGPDAQWRPSDSDALTAQALWSQSQTPNLPELAAEWDGRVLNDHALFLDWSHTTERVDWVLETLDIGSDFRADNGFMPQVGYREAYLDAGYTLRPDQAFASRIRFFTEDYYDVEPDGRPLNQHLSLGSEMDGLWNSLTRFEVNLENVRVGEAWLQRFRPRVLFQASPGRILNQFTLDTRFGQEIDFDNAREGDGINVVASVTVRPNAHLEVQGNSDLRTLNAALPGGPRMRVFTAGVGRVRATWSFTARAFVRVVGQYVETRRDPTMYTFEVPSREAELTGSALAAYKVNWQTVFYLGYGDATTWAVSRADWAPGAREVFAKVSYAWQE